MAAVGDSRRFWRHAVTFQGAVTPIIAPRLFVFGAAATVVTFFRGHLAKLTLEVGPVELAGGALVLLLIVRTNAGYDRWWEGRKLWGGIVNQSRNLAIAALAYTAGDHAWRERCARWVAAFAHVSRRSLRDERTLPEVARLVGEADAERVSESRHMPSAVASELASILRTAVDEEKLSPFAFLQCDHERALLVDHVGACERILKTPLPMVYVIKLRRFVALYLLVLPFALVERVEWAAPFLTMLVAYPILGLDQIAAELENPFSPRNLSHLPLDAICETIERDVLALVEPGGARDPAPRVRL